MPVGKNRYKCKNIPTLWSAIIGASQDLQLILKPIQTPSLRVEINNNNRPRLELAWSVRGSNGAAGTITIVHHLTALKPSLSLDLAEILT